MNPFRRKNSSYGIYGYSSYGIHSHMGFTVIWDFHMVISHNIAGVVL